ncbi:MAG: CPBP family intramembrane metalloprotease [Candidatus Bathyarchaeota archaeon]|nr:MAG: CPBP family intramembrane metalloprotease [Candidatus Bathyarchaeota archaeon]
MDLNNDLGDGVGSVIAPESRRERPSLWVITARSFIKSHEVLTFFLLTYAITWTVMALVPTFTSGGQIGLIAIPLILVAPFSPALSGILITRTIDERPLVGDRKAQAISFLLAMIPTTLIFLMNPNLKAQYEYSRTLLLVSTVTAVIPSFVISSAFSRSRGVREYLASLVKPQGNKLWYLGAILIFPFITFLGVVITNATGQGDIWISAETGSAIGFGALVATTFLYQFVYGNCVGEEPGWRGFAFRKLQSRYSPLVASLIVSFVWILWHLPYWYIERGAVTMGYVFYQFIIGGAIGVILSWIYNRSEGSILAAGLMHASANTSVIFIPETEATNAILLILAFLVTVIDRMWIKPTYRRPSLSRDQIVHDHYRKS